MTLTVGNFFDALKSKRRLNFVAESSVTLASETDRQILEFGDDPFAAHKESQKFRIYATDGHSSYGGFESL